MRMRLVTVSLWCLTVFPVSADDQTIDLAPVKKWIAHQSSVQCVTADFIQERWIRALKRPIINPGKLWFNAPGFLRWELGDPVESIVLQRNDELLLLRPLKKTGHHYARARGNVRNFAPGAVFLVAGFPRSYKEFTENFTVTDVKQEGGSFFFTVKVNDRRTMLALRKIVFQVNPENFYTKGIVLRFRDSSAISTQFTEVHENKKIKDSIFDVELSNYTMIKGN